MRSSAVVLKLLQKHHRLSRGQLADMAGLTNAGVGQIIKQLLASKLVREIGHIQESGSGRPTKILELNDRGGYVLGVALKIESIDIGLIDLAGNWIDGISLPNWFSQDQDQAAVESLLKASEQLLAQCNKPRLLGIGFSTSGVLAPSRQRFVSTNNAISLEQMEMLMIRAGEWFDVPVVGELDIDASLWAEWSVISHTHQHPNIIYANDLLGFSMLINGKRVPESMRCYRSLEMAHVDRQARPTRSGQMQGCLAATASPGALTDQVQGYVFGTRPPIPRKQLREEVHQLYAAYENGEQAVVSMFERAFDDLGFVLRNQAVLFHFDLIILEGWTPRILADGMRRVQAVLQQADYGLPPENVSIPPIVRAASLGNRQQSMGTALSALEHCLADAIDLSSTVTRRKNQPKRKRQLVADVAQ
jgi:predicted NBD/HSP70 family sugar kinase